MSLAIMNNNNNNNIASSSNFEEYNESRGYQNDLEMEEILNEMGFYANDDEFTQSLLLTGDSSPSSIHSNSHSNSTSYPIMTLSSSSSDNFVPTPFAPVSPDHHHHQQQQQFIGGDNYADYANYGTTTTGVISPSSSVEDMQTFSVPNPIAAISALSMQARIAPKSFGGAAAAAAAAAVPHLKTSQKKISKKKTVTKKDPTTKSRKRKAPAAADSMSHQLVSSMTNPFPATAALFEEENSSSSNNNDDEDLSEEQLEERRQRNREHAKRSRQRKKSLTCTLQQSVDELKTENVKLREQIYGMIGQAKAESILETRRETARTQFMDGLMQPTNRILDDTTLAFLKGLQKTIPAASATSSKRQKKN